MRTILLSALLMLSSCKSKSSSESSTAGDGSAAANAAVTPASGASSDMANKSGAKCLQELEALAAVDGKPDYGNKFPVAMGQCVGACSIGHRESCAKFEAEFDRFCAKNKALCDSICTASAAAAKNQSKVNTGDPCVKYLEKAAAK